MKVIDLSTPIHSGMAVYAGDPEVQIEVVHTHEQHSWELRKITMGSHTGTHVDAFSHMHADGKSIDQIPLNRFFGQAIVTRVDKSFPESTGLFFREAVGLEILESILQANPPFVGGLIDEALERALLAAEIVTYTDLVNLHMLPENTLFQFYGFPLRIANGDGSPVRAVAVLD